MTTEIINQFCPECGQGVESITDHIAKIRLPCGYPFEMPCKTCAKHQFDGIKRLGAEMARKQNELALKAMGIE